MNDKVEFNKEFYTEQWKHSWKHRFMYDPISKRKVAQYVLEKIKFRDGHKSVLDIGFGFGIILFTFDKSDVIAGIEIAESAVNFAKAEAKRLGYNNFRFEVYTGEGNIGLQPDSYDLIVCSHVLEHVPDDNFLLKEIYRLLKPGGTALLNVPINEEHFPDPRHVRKYTPEHFTSQLTSHNFKIITQYSADKLWNTFGWFFEKEYHNKIPVLGFILSSCINVFFSSIPFRLQLWIEKSMIRKLPPRQFAVCVTK